MSNKIIDIDNRELDYSNIEKNCWRTEQGIRTICVMYDEHSSDKNSKENIFILKDNVHYKLFSLGHQYLILLQGLYRSEMYLQTLEEKKPNYLNSFPVGNPFFDKVELEVSSIFDNIIIQLSSVFDYISHLVCYICKSNKSQTMYWTKLASAMRDKKNEMSKLDICNVITECDRSFVNKLYDYRSRLLHYKKDKHEFNLRQPEGLRFKIEIAASEIALRHFKAIKKEYPNCKISITLLSSWLIKRTFIEIEKVLDSLKDEIQKESVYYSNMRNPKNDLVFAMLNPETNIAEPVSDTLWEQYKNWDEYSKQINIKR